MRMEEYLEIMTGQIRCRLAHAPIREELRCHMEDQKDAYIEMGMEEEEAEGAAVRDMGDPVRTGEELDRIHRPRIPWKTAGIIIGISLLGFVIQYLIINESVTYVDFRKQFCILVFGWVVMMGICFIDYSRIVKYGAWWYTFFHFVYIQIGDIFSLEVNGSISWIYIPQIGLTISLPQLVLLYVPLFAMLICSCKGNGYFGLLTIVALELIPIFMVVKYPSIAALAVLFISFSFLLTVAVWKGWFRVAKKRVLAAYWGMVGTGIIWIIYNIAAAPNKTTRFHRLFGIGEGTLYATDALRKIIREASWIGQSSGLEENALSYADYMFTYLIGKWGFAPAAVIMIAIIVVIVSLFKMSFENKNRSGMLIGTSCTIVILAQIIIYILSNFGMIATEAYCPFLTYGGTGTIVTFTILGLLLSVFRYEDVMILYRNRSPEEFSYNTNNESQKKSRTEQIRILLVVFILFVILMYGAE